jgi:hypothetical protein
MTILTFVVVLLAVATGSAPAVADGIDGLRHY